jgi:hypothetical protein
MREPTKRTAASDTPTPNPTLAPVLNSDDEDEDEDAAALVVAVLLLAEPVSLGTEATVPEDAVEVALELLLVDTNGGSSDCLGESISYTELINLGNVSSH